METRPSSETDQEKQPKAAPDSEPKEQKPPPPISPKHLPRPTRR